MSDFVGWGQFAFVGCFFVLTVVVAPILAFFLLPAVFFLAWTIKWRRERFENTFKESILPSETEEGTK